MQKSIFFLSIWCCILFTSNFHNRVNRIISDVTALQPSQYGKCAPFQKFACSLLNLVCVALCFLKKKWIRSCNWYFKQTAKLVLHVSNYISNQSCGPASECKLVSFRFRGTRPHLHEVVPDLRAISYPFLRGMSESVRNYNSSELCFPVMFSRRRVCAFHRSGEEAKQPTSRSGKECFASFGKLVVLKVRRWTTFKGEMLTNTSLAGKTGHFPLAKLKSVVSWKEVPT